MPVTLILSRPDGVEHSRVALTDQGLGGRAAKLALAALGHDRHLARQGPHRPQGGAHRAGGVPGRGLRARAARAEARGGDGQALSPQQPGAIKVAGRYLYGPPAAGLSVEGEIAVRASTKEIAGFPGYKFGLADEQFSPVRKTLEELPATDADGKADIAVDLPSLAKTSRPLEADLIVRLRESGGRTIERTVTLPVDLKSARIGIRPLFKGEVGEGETARFEAIVARRRRQGRRGQGPQVGAAAPGAALAVVQPRRLLGLRARHQHAARGRRHCRRRPRRAGQDRGASRLGPLSPGGERRHRARLQRGVQRRLLGRRERRHPRGPRRRPRQAGLPRRRHRARQDHLAHGGPGADRRAELGPRLHAGGGPARRRRRGRRSRVGDAWNPGAYVAVMLYRPIDEKAKRMPSRAVGLRWLAIDQGARTIGVSLDVPEKVESGGVLTVPVKLTGLAAGEEARVTIAATDVGILNLTRFETPKPDQWFFGQRRLGSEIRDLYGRLIDGMRAERGKLRSGGDGAAGWPCRAARRSRRRWRCSPASSRSAPTAPPASSSSCPTSTARCA